MAGLDELFAQIPVQDIASKIGADRRRGEQRDQHAGAGSGRRRAENVQADEIDSSELESAVAQQGASGLLDGGVNVDQVDAEQGDKFVARIFGGNDSNAVASALAGTGAGGGDLIKKLLPILAPIVLAYIGKQFARGARRRRGAAAGAGAPAVAASATCWAASSAAPVAAAGTTRWAASWAACSAAAAARASRSGRFSAACWAARSSTRPSRQGGPTGWRPALHRMAR